MYKRQALSSEEPDWVHLNTDANGLKMNQYFIDHPEMVMGEMREISGPYGPETACAVNHFDLHQFMPADSLYTLSTRLKVEGEGFDFFSPRTYFNAAVLWSNNVSNPIRADYYFKTPNDISKIL